MKSGNGNESCVLDLRLKGTELAEESGGRRIDIRMQLQRLVCSLWIHLMIYWS